MTETIIRWAVSVAFMVLAFLWGYRTGKEKILEREAETLKHEMVRSKIMEQELLKIISDQVTAQTDFINRQEEQLEKINEAISGRAE